MTVEQALQKLIEAGADIRSLNNNLYLVHDNGFWGFVSPTPPFVVDGDDILEMCEEYCA